MKHRMTTSDNEWQRVRTSSTTSDNEWQRATMNENEWQRMATSGTTNDNEWHSEWKRMKENNEGLFIGVGDLARLGGLAYLGEISPSLRNSYKNIICSY